MTSDEDRYFSIAAVNAFVEEEFGNDVAPNIQELPRCRTVQEMYQWLRQSWLDNIMEQQLLTVLGKTRKTDT